MLYAPLHGSNASGSVRCAVKQGLNLTVEDGKRNMELNNVYGERNYYAANIVILYGVLKQRKDYQNISHKEMPSFKDHCKFVESKPYLGWYMISDGSKFIGTIYVGKEHNIGLFILEEHIGKGYGKQALKKIMELHPLDYYLANIAPNNSNSIAFFSNFGFKYLNTLAEIEESVLSCKCITKIIQYTYKFTPSA